MLRRKLRLFSSITDFPQKVKILSFIRTRRTKNPHGSSTYAVPARIFQLFFVLFSSQRIDRIQVRCFYRRQQSENVDLYDAVDSLERDSYALRKSEKANAYLEAELEVCKMVQKVQDRISEEIRIGVPEI